MDADDAAFAERLAAHGFTEVDGVLHFPPGGALEAVQVQEGVIFGRRGGAWAAEEPATVLAWFAEDSPAASWVRRRGADLLRIMLSRAAAPGLPTTGP